MGSLDAESAFVGIPHSILFNEVENMIPSIYIVDYSCIGKKNYMYM